VEPRPRAMDRAGPGRSRLALLIVDLELGIAIGLTLLAPVLTIVAPGSGSGWEDRTWSDAWFALPLPLPSPGTVLIALPVIMLAVGWYWIRRIVRNPLG
jgi:hypothetical protein